MANTQNIIESEWLIVDQLECLHCAYNLRGLVGPLVKCPECGGANNLRDPEPWKVKALPLGVREPQHWPATSVVISFPTILASFFCIGYISEESIAAIIPGFISLLLLVIWIYNCSKWIRSCRSTGEAFVELAVLHISSWAIIGALITAFLFADEYYTVLNMGSIISIIVILLGIIFILLIRRVIINGTSNHKFRVDWQKWCLPVAGTDTDMNDGFPQQTKHH